TLLRDNAGHPQAKLIINTDVTVRKQLEEQLRQSQKMEAIGQLAGGVAHDFNNLLTVIQGHAGLMLNSERLPSELAGDAQQITFAAERAASLTRQLLTFSRRQVMQPRNLDLNEVVANMTRMLQRILGEDISLNVQYTPLLASVYADPGMVEQALLNLVVNSRDAMPRGGQLLINTGVVDIDAASLQDNPDAKAGPAVYLSVRDTGCGIAPENLSHIFEPFFTTKDVGKGTGLGLATVYAVAKQHNGWIRVHSELGNGTTFRIHFPAADPAPGSQEVVGQDVILREGINFLQKPYAPRKLLQTVRDCLERRND